MNPVTKALWFIETHFEQTPSLEEIADAAGVSRFHLTRAFHAAFGYPVMRYVRARRLTEAARMLAAGAPDILAVALDAGYNSHEAFTRAFRDEFSITPEDVRDRRAVPQNLLEPIRMCQTPQGVVLAAPRYLDAKEEMLLAGISEYYTDATVAGIPSQWMRFGPFIGNIPTQKPTRVAYGVVSNTGESSSCDYMTGVEITSATNLPKELTTLKIPPQRYAIFTYPGHVSAIRQVWSAIWTSWMPDSGQQATGGPALEVYGESFDPISGDGGFEIWIPVRTV